MLVLSRHRDEVIAFRDTRTGEEFWLTVVDIRGDKVRIGVTCPDEIEVHRLEVFKAKYGRQPRTRMPCGYQTPKGPEEA